MGPYSGMKRPATSAPPGMNLGNVAGMHQAPKKVRFIATKIFPSLYIVEHC